MALEDPESGERFSLGQVEPALSRVRIYGATASPGATLAADFEHLERVWAPSQYSARQIHLLRQSQIDAQSPLRMAIGPALVVDSIARLRWFQDWDTVPAVWKGFLGPITRAELVGHLEFALDDEERLGTAPRPNSDYVVGLLAQRAGRHQVAIERFTRIIRWPHRVDSLDFGWGLLSLSFFQRANSHEAIGDTVAALDDFRRFAELWSDAESEGHPTLSRARLAITRLESIR